MWSNNSLEIQEYTVRGEVRAFIFPYGGRWHAFVKDSKETVYNQWEYQVPSLKTEKEAKRECRRALKAKVEEATELNDYIVGLEEKARRAGIKVINPHKRMKRGD